MAELPLLRRFPALAGIPRATLGQFSTPLTRVALEDGRDLWVKRDDLTGVALGGNKVRALEWLLGRVRRGEEVLTVGPRGSTHALATAHYATQLGARTTVVRWPQEMNDAARRVDEKLRVAPRVIDAPNVVLAYVIASWLRVRDKAHWIPAGGTTPLGILGHVNAALELAGQIDAGECPLPHEIVVPLGTGGTAAGLVLGLRLAGLRIGVRAVRVAPRVIASGPRVVLLANRTRWLIQRVTGARIARVDRDDVLVDDDYYGGGYGRPIPRAADEQSLRAAGVELDDTYSRKAFAAAARGAGGVILFWLTFDGRLLEEGGRSKEEGA